MVTLISFLVLVAFAVFYFVSLYNNLVTLRNRYKNAFSQIDVQLKRRYDLIPNLVETARAYIKHERETLEAVISARNQAVSANEKVGGNPLNPSAMKDLVGAEGLLNGALGRLMVVTEAYPELKANQTMAGLSEELSSTENKISFARQAFNDAVTTYNIAVEKFPDNILAGMYRFRPAELFETENPEEKKAPKVAFA